MANDHRARENRQTASDAVVSHARDSFLSRADDPDPQLRRMITASWERSRAKNVDVDPIFSPYLRDPDLEVPLARSAAPVLDLLHEQLRGEEVSIILTDHTGLVLDRRCSNDQLTQALGAVHLAPGVSYAEKFVGTNGIGTSLTSRSSAFIDGREPSTHELGQFACSGAPIRHPIHRRVIGILDLTTWNQAPGPILTALASATAQNIEAELRNQTGAREFALFREYMKACRNSPGPVLALNNDVVMMNDPLRRLADPAEQQTLIRCALDTMSADDRQVQRTVDLPTGRTARLRYTPAHSEAGLAGGVFRVRLGQAPPDPISGAPLLNGSRTLWALPGVVGHGSAWTTCIQQTAACYESGEWFVIEGEAGVGKLALIRAVHQQQDSGRHFRIVEAPDPDEFDSWLNALSDDFGIPGTTLVLRHADRLTEQEAAATAELLTHRSWDTDPAGRTRVVITVTTPGSANAATALLSIFFSRTVTVPPLRHHIDDLSELIKCLLSQLTKTDQLTCSAQALAHLARLNWPGNISQLRRVLTEVVQHRRGGIIGITDLPPECRATSHCMLSPIEALERDAIVNALIENDENPTRAAKALGMSRATIYRKIHRYGMTLDR